MLEMELKLNSIFVDDMISEYDYDAYIQYIYNWRFHDYGDKTPTNRIGYIAYNFNLAVL